MTRLASAKLLKGTSRSRMFRSRAKAVESMPQHTNPEMAVYQGEAVRWRAAAGEVRWRKQKARRVLLRWKAPSGLVSGHVSFLNLTIMRV